ncbi:MAG: response regulator [Desulfobacterota bacterium]|nr:response regulator [Thermodesulfobacteriota bacterium]
MIDITTMSVLIADDVESMFNAIRSIMRILGFGKKFHYVSNGNDALTALRQGAYDLAILDNNMPGITGLDLLTIIRSEKELRDMPVIMISGHAEKELIASAAESDIDAYILKPITVNLFKEKIPQIIDKANNPSPMAQALKTAAIFAERGDIDAAIEAARTAVTANQKSSRPLRELAAYLVQKGEYAEAESCLIHATAMNPFDVIACTTLGDLYLRIGELDHALRYYLKAMAISPRNHDRALNVGKLLVKKKLYTKAISVFSRVFNITSDPLNLKLELVDFCMAEGAYSIAEKLLKSVLELVPTRADILCKLGIVYENLGKRDEALRYFIEAESHNDCDIQTKLYIAKNYIARNKVVFAERPLREVLRLDPHNEEAKALLKECI